MEIGKISCIFLTVHVKYIIMKKDWIEFILMKFKFKIKFEFKLKLD